MGAEQVARFGLIVSLVLLAMAVGVVVIGAAVDGRGRDVGPEAVVRGYFAALERGELDAALLAIEPSARASSTAFVANMLNNEYGIQGIAVGHSSILGRLSGEPAGPREVTIFLTITQVADGFRWVAAPRVPLVERDQRWYLARPPLAD